MLSAPEESYLMVRGMRGDMWSRGQERLPEDVVLELRSEFSKIFKTNTHYFHTDKLQFNQNISKGM